MKVVWAHRAIADLEAIAEFIRHDSPHYAAVTVGRLAKAARPLETFPRMGRRVLEAKSDDVRELIVGSYRLMYRIEAERILVVAVIHGSRHLGKLGEPWDPEQR
ncbi:MAG TPA: type II toxin-antitoxin system RelE/ParE family toxin [Thermoanaerobaculia bacterium]|nr:type II toxin-antitoxin system RelE/ParE family toxin [Thermoanaerobaculia bacterium]